MGRIHLLFLRLCMSLGGLHRRMTTLGSPRSSDHLTSTQDSSRQHVISAATVQAMRDESQTVKVLTLKVHDPNFSFKAGQWVDMFIPGVDTVGGFSMCSSPSLLVSEGVLILAVKFSTHPPALWVHTKCVPGVVLHVRVGGDFFYTGGPGSGDVLLVAGGVGVNPLLSMLNHAATTAPHSARLVLMYSASHTAQLIFRKELENLSAAHDNIDVHFFVTRESSVSPPVKAGRISCTDIHNALQQLKKEKLKVFMCGPAPMISDMEQCCLHCGVSHKQLFYERWW